MNKDAIYHVRPADNMKLVEMELNIERLHHKAATPGGKSMLEDVQSLIERIKRDEKKIKQLEKINGITWLGDKDLCLVTGCGREADEETPLGGICKVHWDLFPILRGEEGKKGEKGELIPECRTAAELYQDRSVWDIPINVADGGIREQSFWAGREYGAREMEKEIYGK